MSEERRLGEVAAERRAVDSHERALDLARLFLEKVYESSGYIEFDSCQNFATLKKTDDEVRALLSVAETIKTVPVLPEWTQIAIDIKAKYGLQFYDSLLLAAAYANGCQEFWSEDLSDGQTYCGIKAVNPFRK